MGVVLHGAAPCHQLLPFTFMDKKCSQGPKCGQVQWNQDSVSAIRGWCSPVIIMLSSPALS